MTPLAILALKGGPAIKPDLPPLFREFTGSALPAVPGPVVCFQSLSAAFLAPVQKTVSDYGSTSSFVKPGRTIPGAECGTVQGMRRDKLAEMPPEKRRILGVHPWIVNCSGSERREPA
jgi:hypothetical protein